MGIPAQDADTATGDSVPCGMAIDADGDIVVAGTERVAGSGTATDFAVLASRPTARWTAPSAAA